MLKTAPTWVRSLMLWCPRGLASSFDIGPALSLTSSCHCPHGPCPGAKPCCPLPLMLIECPHAVYSRKPPPKHGLSPFLPSSSAHPLPTKPTAHVLGSCSSHYSDPVAPLLMLGPLTWRVLPSHPPLFPSLSQHPARALVPSSPGLFPALPYIGLCS